MEKTKMMRWRLEVKKEAGRLVLGYGVVTRGMVEESVESLVKTVLMPSVNVLALEAGLEAINKTLRAMGLRRNVPFYREIVAETPCLVESTQFSRAVIFTETLLSLVTQFESSVYGIGSVVKKHTQNVISERKSRCRRKLYGIVQSLLGVVVEKTDFEDVYAFEIQPPKVAEKWLADPVMLEEIAFANTEELSGYSAPLAYEELLVLSDYEEGTDECHKNDAALLAWTQGPSNNGISNFDSECYRDILKILSPDSSSKGETLIPMELLNVISNDALESTFEPFNAGDVPPPY